MVPAALSAGYDVFSRSQRMHFKDAPTGEVLKGAVAGMIAGAAGAWAMNQVHRVSGLLSSDSNSDDNGFPASDSETYRGRPARQFNAESEGESTSQSKSDQEPATVTAANVVADKVLDRELNSEEEQVAGPAVHYGFGVLIGGIYGAAAEVAPPVTFGGGSGFASSLWLLADEVAVPALGLSKPPTKISASSHMQGLAAHLVYGGTVEVVRRLFRKAF